MNTIYQRQNQVGSLTLQATARYYYDKADCLDLIHWSGILVTIFLKLYFPDTIFVDFLLIAWFLIGFLIDYYVETWTTLSADFKEEFDNYVFGRDDNEPKIEDKLIISKIKDNKEWFENQTSNDGDNDLKGVKNWYTIEKEMNQFDSIKFSYDEIVFYDSSINKKLRWIIILVITTFFIIFYFQDLSFTQLINTIFLTTASFTTKVINTIIKLDKTNKLNNKIKNIINNSKSIEELNYAQKYFFEKRQISGVSFSMIYNIIKDEVTKKYNDIFLNPEI